MRPAGPLLALALLAALGGAPAAAEIYRCPGPDGRTLFTTDASQCPGARAHELRGQVQHAAPATRTPASRPASAAAAQEAQGAAAWRHKKAAAQRAAQEARNLVAQLEHAALMCNRGATLYAVDEETGLKQGIPCERVDAELEKSRARQAEADAYLAGGLEEDCRRSGCLPGWIR